MNIDRIKKLLSQHENISLEFKEASHSLPSNVFETICAMLNRDGGDIMLGVSDQGVIQGVDSSQVEILVTNLVNQSNNPQKLDPPFILFPQVHELNGKSIIHIQVPASSQVHKTAQTIFDRSNDGDFKITHPHQIAEIYNRKRTHYTENIVYPALRLQDLKQELFPKVRQMIRNNHPGHPWLDLDDHPFLERAGLWKRDFQLGQEGYTLAAALLFGKDQTIQNILPHYKIDALVRIQDLYRYDDRLYIQTNLIEAYDQLMDFVAKHLPDKFYLQGDQRVSLRSVIFREVIANLIVHREYTSAHPCSFVITYKRVETKNANNPHGEGLIDPKNFVPFAKNPTIAKFFIQLGRVEELGSGVLNVNRFIKEYSGQSSPEFIEGSVFMMHIPIPERAEGIKPEVEGINEGIKQEIEGINSLWTLIKENPGKNASFYAEKMDVSIKTIERLMRELKLNNRIKHQGSKKSGGYYVVE